MKHVWRPGPAPRRTLAVLAMVACVLTALLWVRSYFACDVVRWSDGVDRAWHAAADRGQLIAGRVAGPFVSDSNTSPGVGLDAQAPGVLVNYAPLDGSTNSRFAGFGIVGGRTANGTTREYNVLLPAWFLVLLFAGSAFLVYPRRKPKPGHCPKCGYDLTGNESGVCPECGTATASRSA